MIVVGTKAGLAVALLDSRERVLQEAILRGPPPLGPGASPEARLTAFTSAYLDYLLDHLELVRMSEPRRRAPATGSGRTGSGTGTSRSCSPAPRTPSTPRTRFSPPWPPSM